MPFKTEAEVAPTPNELRKEAGALIKKWRKAAGLTQLAVAEKVGLNYYNFVSAIEQGRNEIPLEKFDIWAKALNRNENEFSRTMIRYYCPSLAKSLFGPP